MAIPKVDLKDKEMINSDLHKLYKRVGDVNQLQMKFFVEKDDKMVNNKEFNEIYYKFKKKK